MPLDSIGPKAIAALLEVQYIGPNYREEGESPVYVFKDLITGSSFTGSNLEEARKSLRETRLGFGQV